MPYEPTAGEIILGRYRLLHLLGAGSHGRVYLAEDLGRGGQRVAFKIVEGLVGATPTDPAEAVLRWVRHPNWAAVLDSGPIVDHDRFQAMRYVDGKSLDQLEGPQDPELAFQLLEDGARVLRALHGHGVIHYDVTPGNLIVEQRTEHPTFVLTDGGLAHLGPVKGVARGTPRFMAPELTEDRGHDHRVDLYSLGLVAFRLLTGADPFEGDAGEVLGARRREEAPRVSTLRVDVPKPLDDLVASLLQRDPNARPPHAHALLDRIAAAREVEVPVFSSAETAEASSGGALVGRTEHVARFQETVRQVARHVPDQAGAGTRQPCTGIADPVVLLTGSAGCGATHLVRTLSAEARDAGLPVLMLAGRDTAPDRRSPLRRLVDGLNALGRQPDERYKPVRLDLRSAQEAEDHVHATGRAIEVLLRVAEKAAERTPWILVVEDFGGLPDPAQQAVRVLSRHLLARAEHSGRRSQPAIAMAIDLGSHEPDSLLIPDADDPRRPIAELEPLSASELEALCADRYEGLSFLPDDQQAVRKASEGLPGVAVALLGEGAERGDLRFEAGRWHWDVRDVSSYPIRRGLSPEHRRLLEELDPATRSLIEHMAVIDEPIPEAAARLLAQELGLDDIPLTPLLSTSAHSGPGSVSLASRAVGACAVQSLDGPRRVDAVQNCVRIIERLPGGGPSLVLARLLAQMGEPARALAAIDAAYASTDPVAKNEAQEALRHVLESAPTTWIDAHHQHTIARLLHDGVDAAAIAASLLGTFRVVSPDATTAVTVATVLDSAQRFEEAREALRASESTAGLGPLGLASWHLLDARTSLQQGRVSSAGDGLRCAHEALRSSSSTARKATLCRARYLLVRSHYEFANGRPARSIRLLRVASRLARTARRRDTRALVFNNLGIAYQFVGQLMLARRCFERSARLKSLLGDVAGAAKTRFNQAALSQVAADPLRAVQAFQDCVSISLRHGLRLNSIKALRALGEIYDQQRNPRMAALSLQRAVRAATTYNEPVRGALCAGDLAQIHTASGDLQAAREALTVSAAFTRTAPSVEALAHHYIARYMCALVAGDDRLASALRARLNSRGTDSPGTAAVIETLDFLARACAPDTATSVVAEPRWRNRASTRHLVRVAHWAQRVRRRPEGPPPPLPWETRLRGGGVRVPPSGMERRLTIDAAVRTLSALADVHREPLFNQLEHCVEAAGERLMLARVLGQRAACSPAPKGADRARALSRAVAKLPETISPSNRAAPCPPREFQRIESNGRQINPTSIDELHAIAHRELVRHGGAKTSDDRVASALRRVLDATARMKAGGGLEDLLRDMTRSAIEITGAERACVVRFDESVSGAASVVSSAGRVDQGLSLEDLSNTVIQRVVDSHRPLLLHDVFDDEELLGRPSITNLSLRSILCVPMLRGETLYGVLYADNASAAGSFDNVDLEVLSLFAEQAAAALETNRLVSDLQHSMDELKAMQERLVRGERLRVIGELSSGVAHEFNNLLTSILARVQLLNLNPLSPTLRNELELIEKACLDAAEVVRRLQSFSKSQREGHFRLLDVAEICSDAVEFLRPLWTTRRRQGKVPIDVRLRVERDVHVQGDPTGLREVLTNLLKNALDVLADGGHIEIRAVRRADQVRISVIDDGPGIPSEILPKVCDPFFTTKGERGTGLGLCLSQQIIEQHGGTFEIHSEPGRGTAIHLLLPSSDAAGQAEAVLSNGFPIQQPARLRVLVVDDDDDVRNPLCAYLERAGFDVVSAASGREGLESAPRERPDVVISDIGMPGIDGLELCRRLSREMPDLPIVLMSGWASGVDPSRARRVGATALLAKPFAMQEVTELLTTLGAAVN